MRPWRPRAAGIREAERVDQTLTKLSEANEARDADTVISLLTPRTIDYYNDAIRLACTAKKDEVLRQGPTVLFEVLYMRLLYSEPQLKKLTADSYIREAVKHGTWQFLFDDEDLDVGKPVVAGDSARVPLRQKPPERVAGFGRRGPEGEPGSEPSQPAGASHVPDPACAPGRQCVAPR